MKVIYCIAGTFNAGGMERVLSLKTDYLVKRGYDVTIVTTDQKNKTSFFTFNKEIKHIDLGINYATLSKSLFVKVLLYPFKQIVHFYKLRKLLKNLNADIVVSMFDHEVSFLYKISDKSKKILEIHFSRFKRIQYGRTGIWKFIDTIRSNNDVALAQKYDKFVVLTKEDKLYWGNIDNIVDIPNAQSFQPSNRSTLLHKKVIAIGRLDYQKGFDDLIESWSYLDSQYKDWILEIYGNGPLEESLRNQILELGLEDHIFIKAPVDHIMEKYIDSSILVMTSRYEGLPMALLEGQVCGLPLVAYACKYGPRDLIADGVNGILVEQGDKKGIADALERLMADINLRKAMGDEALLNAKNYELDVVMNQWETLFKTVL